MDMYLSKVPFTLRCTLHRFDGSDESCSVWSRFLDFQLWIDSAVNGLKSQNHNFSEYVIFFCCTPAMKYMYTHPDGSIADKYTDTLFGERRKVMKARDTDASSDRGMSGTTEANRRERQRQRFAQVRIKSKEQEVRSTLHCLCDH